MNDSRPLTDFLTLLCSFVFGHYPCWLRSEDSLEVFIRGDYTIEVFNDAGELSYIDSVYEESGAESELLANFADDAGKFKGSLYLESFSDRIDFDRWGF